MFYSRPDIKPLNWDLTALPRANGSRNYDAITTDGKPLGFRFSSGWLTAKHSEAGGPNNYNEMKNVIVEQSIAPFGTQYISPEQICDILGLTVQGEKVSAPSEEEVVAIKANMTGSGDFFDWSGRTVHWVSQHMLMQGDDVQSFKNAILNKFRNSILFYPSFTPGYKAMTCRPIASEESFISGVLGIGAKVDMENLFNRDISPRAYQNMFSLVVNISAPNRLMPDSSGKDFINKKAGAETLQYETTNFHTYSIRAEYKNSDELSHVEMRNFLTLLNEYFFNMYDIYNIQTGALVKSGHKATDYSHALKNWCLEKPDRYLKVGVEEKKSWHVPASFERLSKDDETLFYGLRPQP